MIQSRGRYKIAYMGLLLALALILSYVEGMIPLNIGIPGVKAGLSNLPVIICLYIFTWKEAICLTVLKALISSFMFGNMTMLIYSLAGAVSSCIIMAFFKRVKQLHILTVSALGGIMHNMAQLLVAYLVIRTKGLIYYLPLLVLSGAAAGLITGMISASVLPYIKKISKWLYK